MAKPVNEVSGEPVTAVDLFCGAGGLAYGLASTGIRVAAGVDVDQHCRYPFERNCNGRFIHADVDGLSPAVVADVFEGASVRVLAGCAPCQPFSTYAQSRRSPDERWRLLRSFARLTEEVRPEIVTMENVPGLARQAVWAEFVDGLRTSGYHVWFREVACQAYGVPQTRRRLVLLASLFGPIELEAPGSIGANRTVRETIGDLPRIEAGEAAPADELHVASKLSARNMERMLLSRPGGTWREWPEDLRARCHLRATGETYPSVYGRMEWDAPAPTITTQFFGFGNGRYGHPEQNRAISIREAAILQSFPNDYAFVEPGSPVTFRNLGIMIGNAVPPKLGAAIGRAITSHVDQALTAL